ncbi:ferritin family protein [Chloroflexota bacterium]
MGLFFTGKELINIAVGIEKNGAAFYDVILASIKDDTVRKTFQYLADSEREHIRIFQNMLSSVETIQPLDTYTEEYDMYLKSLVDSAVFSNEQKAKDAASKVSNTDEAIQIALTAEKESILFYSTIWEFSKRSEQEIITKIIDEEKYHVRQLVKLRKT